MAVTIYENSQFRNKIDEEYFIDFYKEILNEYLPPRHRAKSIDRIREIDLRKALEKWIVKNSFHSDQLGAEFKKFKIVIDSLMSESLELITLYQLENIKISSIDTSIRNCEILKNELFNFNRQQSLKILYNIKNNSSAERKSEFLLKYIDNLFVNREAYIWFMTTIENKISINKSFRGINAFVNALLNNEDVMIHILLKSYTKKKMVEFLNIYYGGEDGTKLIKNHTKLSDPTKHNDEVKKLIKRHIDSTKQLNSTFFRKK